MKTQSITIPLDSMLTESEQSSKTVGYSVAFIVLGMSRAVLGPTLPILAEQTHVSISAISILFTATALGGLAGSVAGGWLYDRIPGHPMLTAMLGVIAAIFFAIPIIPSLWVLTGFFLLIGIAESIVDLGGNTLLLWVHREKVGPFMNALHFFFGVGAFLSPILVGWMVGRGGDITRAYLALALLIIPVAIGFVFLPSPVSHAATAAKGKADINLLLVGGVALFFFLYAGAETAFGGWIYTYAVRQKLTSPTQAAYLTSIFWGALTLGRLLSIPLSARLRPVALLFGSLAGCLLCLALIWLFPHSAPMLWVASCGVGVSMAAVFPTTLSFSERRLTITGQVTGLFFVGACLGAMSIPWAIGQMMEFRGPQSMMALLLVCIVAAGMVFTGICLKGRTTMKREA